MLNFKPINNIIILLLVMLFGLTSVQATENAISNESSNVVQDIVKRGKLVVAMYSKDAPPFYYVNKDNQLTGFDVVLIEGFAKLLGVPVEFNRSAKFLDDTVTMVQNHEVDLAITKLSMTFNRASRVFFSDPYITLHQSLLINRLELTKQMQGRPQEEVIQNLSGKLGVVAKSSYADYAKHFKNMEVVPYSAWGDAIKDAREGKITAVFRDDAEIKLIAHDRPEYALDLMSVILKDAKDPKGIAVSKDHNQLRLLINLYIKSLDWKITADQMINNYDKEINKLKQKIAMQEQQ
ncbi:MAG: transporter substrate-binding domain-containing protein [Methylococcales bacterium]|jgi:polar amino acid transport system substrate-binding protein